MGEPGQLQREVEEGEVLLHVQNSNHSMLTIIQSYYGSVKSLSDVHKYIQFSGIANT